MYRIAITITITSTQLVDKHRRFRIVSVSEDYEKHMLDIECKIHCGMVGINKKPLKYSHHHSP